MVVGLRLILSKVGAMVKIWYEGISLPREVATFVTFGQGGQASSSVRSLA